MNPLLLAEKTLEAVQRLERLSGVGKKIMSKGKKIIEVARPMVKKASQISLNFLPNDAAEKELPESKNIQLSEKLDIVENGLSLPMSYQENQFKMITQKISDDLDIIKGQNEILFLSNSVNYFVESHRMRTGIDRGISHALQYDMVTVCNYLKKNKELRFPGYLLHQFTSLSETIKELNVFYVSILQDGHVPLFDEEEVKEELLQSFGIDERRVDFGSYVPHEMKVRILKEQSELAEEKQKSTSLLDTFKEKITSKDMEQFNIFAHDSLFTLKEELTSNEILEAQILKKLKTLPSSKLLIESRPQSDDSGESGPRTEKAAGDAEVPDWMQK